MLKNKKFFIILGAIAIFFLLIFFFWLFIELQPAKPILKSYPQIILKGDKVIELNFGETFLDPGYIAKDELEGDLTVKVVVDNPVNVLKAGTYEITYTVVNEKGFESREKRFVMVNQKRLVGYQDYYNNIDNTKREWWSGNKKDHARPLGAANEEELKKYNAYFMGADEKVIYLTFDEGSNDTYVKEIMEVLNKNDVKGTFFFCKNFIVNNAELMKDLVKSGHSVGNHTANHAAMYELATKENYDRFLKEITENEEVFKNITGVDMDMVYREPKGEYSLRSLQIVKDLGYKSFFWSADYLDWNGDVAKEKAYDELFKRHHNGAIYLIHPKNKGNYEALEMLIQSLKKEGYRFDLVKNIK